MYLYASVCIYIIGSICIWEACIGGSMRNSQQGRKLDTATRIAREAGTYLLEHFRKDDSLAGRRGTAKEITTRYDKGSDRIIVGAIEKQYPAHNILTEESGRRDKRSAYTWIVDSLDGSSNFANGNPFFAVSIALVKNAGLELGVVYAPFLDEMYVAEKGKGATLNGKRIHVSDTADIAKTYLLACEGGDKSNERLAGLMASLHPIVKDMRKLGSAALEGCYVGCGRAEAYVTFSIDSWDIAAAALIVREAGGRVTDFSGRKWPIRRSDAVMSNGKVHEEILKYLKKQSSHSRVVAAWQNF